MRVSASLMKLVVLGEGLHSALCSAAQRSSAQRHAFSWALWDTHLGRDHAPYTIHHELRHLGA